VYAKTRVFNPFEDDPPPELMLALPPSKLRLKLSVPPPKPKPKVPGLEEVGPNGFEETAGRHSLLLSPTALNTPEKAALLFDRD
jgi:hypothetical protein